jgi:hypothetical protein
VTALRARAGEGVALLVFGLIPARLLIGPVGPFRAPGLEGDGLYGQLFAGAVVRRWLRGEVPPGALDAAGDLPWWPKAPAAALAQALLPVDPAWALGLVVAAALWLGGVGPWRLARRVWPAAPWWGPLLAGLAAQTSPVLLRAVPGVDLAALAVGPIALGLAHPRLAWLAGLWSAPGALGFAVLGLLARRPAWLVAGIPALGLLVPASTLPAAMSPTREPAATAPAYVAAGGAVFPLPPEEQAPLRAAAALTRTGRWLPAGVEPRVRGNLFLGPPPTPGAARRGPPAGPEGAGAAPPATPPPGDFTKEERPWFGTLLVPLQRVHGGVAALVGLLLLLLGAGAGEDTRLPERQRLARLLGLGGTLAFLGVTAAFGWQAAPGELENAPTVATELALMLDPTAQAGLPGGGVLAWSAWIVAIGAVGIAGLVTARGVTAARLAAAILLVGAGVPLENPRLVAPVASVPPDPVRATLAALPAGKLLLFPAPQWPYLQGQLPFAAALWEAAEAGQEPEVRSGDPAAAAVIGALSALTGAPVDAAAAERLWEARSSNPMADAAAAGWRYLLVDLEAIPPLSRPLLDGWLAERAGMPVARDGVRLLYDLSAGPAGVGGSPGSDSALPQGHPPGAPPPAPPEGPTQAPFILPQPG